MAEDTTELHDIKETSVEALPEEKVPLPADQAEFIQPELAEGLELDPRYMEIQDKLISDWENAEGESILSAEGQDYMFGDPLAFRSGEEMLTLDDRIEEAFANRYPEDYKSYQEIEKDRIYDNLEDDPAVKAVREAIVVATNKDVGNLQEGLWGEALAAEANSFRYGNIWNRNYSRVSMQEWSLFLDKYPKKAEAYRDRLSSIQQVFEGRERLAVYRERQEELEEAIPKTIEGNDAFIGFMYEDQENGLNARVWEGVLPGESLTAAQYDEKARAIRKQMIGEFTEAHPDVADEYKSEIEEELADREAGEEEQLDLVKSGTAAPRAEGVDVGEVERGFRSLSSDYLKLVEARRELEAETDGSNKDELPGEVFSQTFAKIEKPYSFVIEEGGDKQREISIYPSDDSLTICEVDGMGNVRRWQIQRSGQVDLAQTGFTNLEGEGGEETTRARKKAELRVLRITGEEAVSELNKLIEEFLSI